MILSAFYLARWLNKVPKAPLIKLTKSVENISSKDVIQISRDFLQENVNKYFSRQMTECQISHYFQDVNKQLLSSKLSKSYGLCTYLLSIVTISHYYCWIKFSLSKVERVRVSKQKSFMSYRNNKSWSLTHILSCHAKFPLSLLCNHVLIALAKKHWYIHWIKSLKFTDLKFFCCFSVCVNVKKIESLQNCLRELFCSGWEPSTQWKFTFGLLLPLGIAAASPPRIPAWASVFG